MRDIIAGYGIQPMDKNVIVAEIIIICFLINVMSLVYLLIPAHVDGADEELEIVSIKYKPKDPTWEDRINVTVEVKGQYIDDDSFYPSGPYIHFNINHINHGYSGKSPMENLGNDTFRYVFGQVQNGSLIRFRIIAFSDPVFLSRINNFDFNGRKPAHLVSPDLGIISEWNSFYIRNGSFIGEPTGYDEVDHVIVEDPDGTYSIYANFNYPGASSMELWVSPDFLVNSLNWVEIPDNQRWTLGYRFVVDDIIRGVDIDYWFIIVDHDLDLVWYSKTYSISDEFP
jgi:hypothetical protein